MESCTLQFFFLSLLVNDAVICADCILSLTDEWIWSVSGMIWGKVEVLGQDAIPVLFCLPQNPHGFTWYQTWVCAVTGEWWTAWAVVWSILWISVVCFFCRGDSNPTWRLGFSEHHDWHQSWYMDAVRISCHAEWHYITEWLWLWSWYTDNWHTYW